MKLSQTSCEIQQKKGFEPDTSTPGKTWLSAFPQSHRWAEGVWLSARPRRSNVPHYICHPLEHSCRGTRGRVHVQLPKTVFAPAQTCRYLTFPPSDSLLTLVCGFVSLLWLQFSSQTEQLCVSATHRNNSAIFFPLVLLLCRCHNLDDSLISNYLKPNFLELVCFSVDWEAN